MNSTFIICLVSICSLSLAYQVNERETLPPKLPLRAGDLLKSLDELTSDAQIIYSPLQETPSADRRVYHDESAYDNVDPSSDEYDRAYEDFVRKYFAQGEDDLQSEGDEEKTADLDEVVPYTADADAIDQPKPKKKSSKSKKCERVEIDNQNCLVCEDLKSNEKSKSCSYSSESKPKSYGFSRERSTKKSNDSEESDEDDGSAEVGKSLKREAISKKERIQPRRTSVKAFISPAAIPDNEKCTRKKEDGMICYYCGTTTDSTRECMADKGYPKKHRLDESSKKDSTTKNVFKRMVTYSYKNDAEPEIKENTYAAFRGY